LYVATYPPKLKALLDDLAGICDRDIRAELLIEYAQAFREVSPTIAVRPFTEAHRVPACESEAFVWAERRPDGRFLFHYAVENPQGISAKALAEILREGLEGCSAADIALVKDDLALDIFGHSLTMGKGQGLMSIVGMSKFWAARLEAEAKS
jgi:cysteine desulfuration protein SufE